MASLGLGFTPLTTKASSSSRGRRRFQRLIPVRANAFHDKPVHLIKVKHMIQRSPAVVPLMLFEWLENTEIAHATGVDLIDRPAYPQYTAEQWVEVLTAWGGIAVAYFIVLPPLIYAYLHTRWMKRNKYEAYFHFFLVFFFFPALLIWGPFINLRPLPTDPTKKNPWD